LNNGLGLIQNSSTSIKNCWIHNNGTDESPYYGAGMWLDRPVETPLLRNNTIYDNHTYGIQVSELGADPNILNCIIYANDSNDLDRENEDFEKVNYSCLQNSHAGSGNITGDPNFMNPGDPNDLHIAGDSPCRDAGDTNGSYVGETDIDGEDRVKYGRVDMGADEYYWSSADFNEDGLVNFIGYAVLGAAWGTDANDANYNEVCDLEDNNNIDFKDVELFCEDWLWETAWGDSWIMSMGMSGGCFGAESMMVESAFGLEIAKTGPIGSNDDLMLSSAIESLAARPERLRGKSDKFYAVNAFNTVSALRARADAEKKVKEVDFEAILKWLAEIWLDPEVRKTIDEEMWKNFVASVNQFE
jgi:hypothetical protein